MIDHQVYTEQETPQVINQRYLESIKEDLKRQLEKLPKETWLDVLLGDDATFRIFTDFEIYYRIIFGSQIELLVKLYQDNKYISKAEIEIFFKEQMKKRKIDFDVQFDKWLEFLILQNLIRLKREVPSLASYLAGDMYGISDKGIAFLTYIANRQYDKKDIGL